MPTGDNWGPTPSYTGDSRGTGRWYRRAWLRRSLAAIVIVAVALIIVGTPRLFQNRSKHATALTPTAGVASAITTAPAVTPAAPATTTTVANARPWAGLTSSDQQTCHEAYDAAHSVAGSPLLSVNTYNQEFYAAVSALIQALEHDYSHVPQAAAQVAHLCGPYYSQ